jgi:signal transduction histidine kinase/ligand-binding sensor domain-containing protein
VYSIFQDRRGFIWFGTGDGLNRYDGSAIRAYYVPAPAGTMPSSFVRGKLCDDDSGNIWFANENGLHCWSARQERLETRARQLPGESKINSLLTACSEGQSLWLFSQSTGAARYDLVSKTLERFPLPGSLPENRTSMLVANLDFTIGPDKSIWFKGTDSGAFYCFDVHKRRYTRVTSPNGATYIFFGKGRNYLVSWRGFALYDSLSGRSAWHAFPGAREGLGPIQMVEDRWGRAWIATFSNGLYCYDHTSGQMRHYVHSNVKLASLPIDLVPSLYIDRADNLWAGTDGGGASRLDLKPPRFHLFPLNEGDYPSLSDYFTKCFYEDEQGLLWFGTHSNGFCVLNTQTGDLENYSRYGRGAEARPLRVVGAIQPSGDGRVWIAHTFGFSLFDRTRKHFENVPISPAPQFFAWSGYAWALCPLQDGRVIGGTRIGIVVFNNKGGRWRGRSYERNPSLNGFVTSIAQMKDGSVWVACKGSGVLRLEAKADSFQVTNRYLQGLNVRGLHPDEKYANILWIASSNGLARLDTRSGDIHFKGMADGMSNAYIYGLLEDEHHNFWMSTNGGLIYYDRQADRFSTYTYADGLQSNEFNSGAYLRGRSGRLYFGGIRGFNWLDPHERVDPHEVAPKVALLELKINGQPLLNAGPEQVSLPYTQNNIAFRIAVLDYSRPEANRVACLLEGWDKDWIESRAHEMHYSNLPPGQYRLRVKGQNAAGLWSNEQTLAFSIRAPFWETPLFYALSSLLLLGLLTGIGVHFFRRKLRAQKRVIERQNMLMAERARISKDMHDEIGSGLTRIAMMSESLRMPTEKIEEARRISGAARNLSQSMSEIVWALSPSHDTIEGLLAYLREQINSFLEPFDIDCRISFPAEPPELPLSNVQRRNLYLTAKEAVGNVLKHADATTLHVNVTVDKSTLRFEVNDDGKGFCRDDVRRSANGLRNMQRRMEEIGGWYECESSARGTVIRFGISLRGPVGMKLRRRATTFFTLRPLRRKNTFEV